VPWFESSGLQDADVIIINRGAHYVEDAEHVKGLMDALWFLRQELPREAHHVQDNARRARRTRTWVDRPLTKE